jgi:hypothetical protein
MTRFSESIHVELANKGGEVAMFEVPRQHFLGKLADVLDIEGIGSGGPADDRFNLSILNVDVDTSTISRSLVMKRGIWLFLPFLLRLRFIYNYTRYIGQHLYPQS